MAAPLEPTTNKNDRHEHWLSVAAPDGTTRMYPLDRPRLVVGRAPECEIVLDDDAISRHHAEILHDPFGRWLIHDLGSRNGLKVDGDRVPEHALLPKVKVRLDKYTLQYSQMLPANSVETSREAEPCPVTDTADMEISTFDGGADTRLAASHLFALLDLTRSLMLEDNAEQRRRLLCELMVNSPFGARGAMLLRLDSRSGQAAPHVLGQVHTAAAVSPTQLHISRRLLDRVAETGETLLASNAGVAAAQVSLSISTSVVRMSAVAAPLSRDGQSLDVLYVVLPGESGSREWQALTALAAEHFQHAEDHLAFSRKMRAHGLVEQDLARAREIQTRLLPGPLELPELDVAWCYEPCRWVGGDYLDVMRLSDGRVFLGVGDVCGKGLQAALISSSFHTLMRSLLPLGGPLSAVLRRAGEHLALYLPGGAFVTLLGVILDPASGQCEVVNAGHPELIQFSSDGTLTTLEGGVNPPLGLSDAEPQTQRVALARGDALMMYTDGWPDLAAPSGEHLGERRFLATAQKSFARYRHLAARSRIDQISAAVETFRCSALPSDDRALLLAQRGP
jgi:phosphoserine phosphatase RsbU/P